MSGSEQLRQIVAFSHLDDSQLESIVACSWTQRYTAGAHVFEEGEPTRETYALLSGEIHLKRRTRLGEFTYSEVHPGELFGESSLVDQLPRPGEAEAHLDAELLTVDPDRLAALMAREPQLELGILWALWRSLSGKLRRSNERLKVFFEGAGAKKTLVEEEVSPGRDEGDVNLEKRREFFQEQKLSSMEINFLATLSRHERFQRGDVIFREGDSGEKMYAVLDGEVMISKSIAGAGQEALAFLQRGDYFGEMALIDNAPRSATAKAHADDTVVLSVAREVVEGLLRIEKVSSTRLLRILCSLVARRLHESDRKLVGWYLLAGKPEDDDA